MYVYVCMIEYSAVKRYSTLLGIGQYVLKKRPVAEINDNK